MIYLLNQDIPKFFLMHIGVLKEYSFLKEIIIQEEIEKLTKKLVSFSKRVFLMNMH